MSFRRQPTHATLCAMLIMMGLTGNSVATEADEVFRRVSTHQFHPLNEEGTFTLDRHLEKHGIADLDDSDGRVRLLAIRDLVRLLPDQRQQVEKGLAHDNLHVRQITAAALGIGRQAASAGKLQNLLKQDPSPVVRAQTAMSLGQVEASEAIAVLTEVQNDDASRDVRHQCELAIDQIRKGVGASREQLQAFRSLNPDTFSRIQAGDPAIDFTLQDTDGQKWNLKHAGDGKWVMLVWIFADWCPVCHGEFNELIEMREQFEERDIVVATIECHDLYRCRVMVGKEADAEYWFLKQSFQEKYRESIWWPHLSDLAGAVGARYGIDPMTFAVHAEYINRPSTIIIDPQGTVRLAYFGTYWGDRPSMHEVLEMIETEKFDYEHPKRLEVPQSDD